MNAVLASNNAHKLTEIRALLKDKFDRIDSLKDLGIEIEIEETGATFLDNALIKARAVCALTGRACIADDSGLCVEALDGAPGVYSARYAGKPCDDAANNRLLLDNLHKREQSAPRNRKACFVSVVALCRPDGSYVCGEGKTYGQIIDEARGDNGFGYDPYFLSDDLGVTFAEARLEDKNRVSHRARALAQLVERL